MMRVVVVASLVLSPAIASAHAFNPALVELRERENGVVEVSWKVTASSDEPTAMRPLLPDCQELGRHETTSLGTLVLERWRVDCGAGGLTGRTVKIVGFTPTDQDVLLRIATVDRDRIDVVLRPGHASFVVSAHPVGVAVLGTYLRLGIDHILSGYDHLLFVLGLILLVAPLGRLFVTISTFTVAHSITLSLAALHVVRFPTMAVEAVIALSVVFLAVELAERRAEPGLAARSPWVIAFAFGLLHGFGFAGALVELGLPSGDIPLALLGFNAGVEIGQLLFIAVVLAILGGFVRIRMRTPTWGRTATVYLIGTLSAYWCWERIAAFWA